MIATQPGIPTRATRMLGVLGIAGGLGLLLAYLAEIPPGWNTVRLVLFCAGAIAIGLAAYGCHAAVSRPLARAGTIPVIAANAWYIAWILLSLGEERPFAGDFGMAGFWAALSFWLADGWFGFIALRLGVLWRWAAAALVLGSVLAILGMDRLGFTSAATPTVFGQIALAGVALNGLAWMVLGVQIALPGLGRAIGRSPARGGTPGPAGGPAGRP